MKASDALCIACGYNGPGFYQAETHPCAAEFHRTGKWKKPEDVPPIVHAATQLRNIVFHWPPRAPNLPLLTQEQARLLWHERQELHELLATLAAQGTNYNDNIRQRLKKVLEEL